MEKINYNEKLKELRSKQRQLEREIDSLRNQAIARDSDIVSLIERHCEDIYPQGKDIIRIVNKEESLSLLDEINQLGIVYYRLPLSEGEHSLLMYMVPRSLNDGYITFFVNEEK